MADDRLLNFPNAKEPDPHGASPADEAFAFEAPDLDMLPPPDADWPADQALAPGEAEDAAGRFEMGPVDPGPLLAGYIAAAS